MDKDTIKLMVKEALKTFEPNLDEADNEETKRDDNGKGYQELNKDEKAKVQTLTTKIKTRLTT